MWIRSVEVWVAKKKTIPPFFGSFFLLSYISSSQYFKNLLVHMQSLTYFFFMEKQIELRVGFSNVLLQIRVSYLLIVVFHRN